MNFKKRFFVLVLSAIVLSAFTACSSQLSQSSAISEKTTDSIEDNATDDILENDNMFTSRDMKTDYDESSAVKITLSDNNIVCSDESVAVSNNIVTISKEGTYILSGKLNDGQIIVNADKTDKLQLVLDKVEINSESGAPIYVKQADKVFITLAPNSENTLTNNTEFTSDGDVNIDAVIFSKEDITLNGKGILNISTNCGHGIVSKDDLKLTSGTYKIDASNHTLSGKDSVRIANGTYTLVSGKDGIHSANSDDASLGFIYLAGGIFNITSDGDGLDASSYLQIKAGTLNINAGGGVENAEVKRNEFTDFYGGRNQSYNSDDSISSKGVKSTGDIIVDGGTILVNSVDDSFHSDANLYVNGGKMEITTGDDGIHSDDKITISDGTIDITQSYEGIEGAEIEITGGTINIVANDDGLNAAGGNDESGFSGGMQRDNFASNSSAKLSISGGKININALGDGIDSNGNLYVSGGEIYVSGPENGGNGALDYDGTAEITGGILVAAGNSTMAQNFGSSSTQGSILYNSMSQGIGEVVLKNNNGDILVSYTPENSYNSVVVSCPNIKQGENYTLTMNGEDYNIEMTSLIYGNSNSRGGGPQGYMGRQH